MNHIYSRRSKIEDMFVARAVSTPVSYAPVPESRALGARGMLVSLTTLVLIASLALAQGTSTIAYFSDQEISTGNTFAAGPLDFTVAADPLETTLGLGNSQDFPLSVTPAGGSLPFSYRIIGVASSTPLCAALTASIGSPFSYTGPLASLTTATSTTLTSSLSITLPSNASGIINGDTCTLDLAFEGMQEGGNPGQQFHDTEHVLLTIHASVPPIVIPEVQSLITPLETDTPPSETASPTEPLPPETT